jgi:hypothetical protein
MISANFMSHLSVWPVEQDPVTGLVMYRHPIEDLVSLHPVFEFTFPEFLERIGLVSLI